MGRLENLAPVGDQGVASLCAKFIRRPPIGIRNPLLLIRVRVRVRVRVVFVSVGDRSVVHFSSIDKADPCSSEKGSPAAPPMAGLKRDDPRFPRIPRPSIPPPVKRTVRQPTASPHYTVKLLLIPYGRRLVTSTTPAKWPPVQLKHGQTTNRGAGAWRCGGSPTRGRPHGLPWTRRTSRSWFWRRGGSPRRGRTHGPPETRRISRRVPARRAAPMRSYNFLKKLSTLRC